MGMDLYRSRLSIIGTDKKEKITNKDVEKFNSYLKSSANKEEIKIKNFSYDVVILTDKQTEASNSMKLLAPLDVPVSVGSTFKWKNENWFILMEEIQQNKAHYKMIITKCNNMLKWMNIDGVIQERAIYVRGYKGANFDRKQTGGIIVMDNKGEIEITVGKDKDTITIAEEQRFILNRQAYEVVGIDNMSNPNLIYLTLGKDKINKDIDNLILGVADYYKSVKADSMYDLMIITKNNLPKIVLNDVTNSIELSFKLYKNGTEIKADTSSIIWNIKNSDIAIVSGNTIKGVETGETILTATMVEYPSVMASVKLIVNEADMYVVEGKQEIKWGREAIYAVKKNGILSTDISNFSIGITTLATLEILGNNQCKITANNNRQIGNINLTVDTNGNITIIPVKIVNIF